MVKFKELAWGLGEVRSIGFTRHGQDEYYLLAARDMQGAAWGVNTPKRMHFNPKRDDKYQIYDIDLATLMNVNVPLEDIKKKKISIEDIEIFETEELANKASGWVKDPKLKEIVPLFDPMGKGIYLHYREQPKESLQYYCNSCIANNKEPTGENDERIDWLKSYLKAQKIPFEIEKSTFKDAPHPDRITVK